jgi:hypothetical protein
LLSGDRNCARLAFTNLPRADLRPCIDEHVRHPAV